MNAKNEDPALWLRRFVMTAGPRLSRTECALMMQAAELLALTALTRDAMAGMLDQLAVIVKGEPEPGCAWGFEDLPELVAQLVAQARGEVH